MRNQTNKSFKWDGCVLRTAAIIAVTYTISGCSRTPEPDTPGQCPIDCSKAVIGTSDFTATSIVVPAAISCVGVAAGSVKAIDPVLLMFKVTGTVAGTPGVPRRAISIQPVVSGAMDAAASEKAGNVTKLGDGTYEPTRYIGIATPKEEWCTDACGVFSVEVTPVCAPGLNNTVSVTPTSGSMTASPATFVVTASSTTLNATGESKSKK